MPYLKILAFGDIVGKPGRQALIAKLPDLKKKYKPDLTIANAENLAHGFGVTEKTLGEMQDIGIDFFTSGNHIFKKETDLDKIFSQFPIIRPANYTGKQLGAGYKIIEVGTTKILMINLMGQVFIEEKFDNPFSKLDEILRETKTDRPDIIIVDFHAEATSEKKSLGFYADGKVSLLFGTHTHVQTADEDILPKGTGYLTDVGMVGIKHSSLGMDLEGIIKSFRFETEEKKVIANHGLCTINAFFAKINTTEKQTVKIERISEEVEI